MSIFPHATYDELHQYIGQVVVLHTPKDSSFAYTFGHNHALNEYQDYVFVNFANDKIVNFSKLSNNSSINHVGISELLLYKDSRTKLWTHITKTSDDSLLRTFVPEFDTDYVLDNFFNKVEYRSLVPQLVNETTGEIATFDNMFAFTEEVVNYENFKWYRLHICNSSINSMVNARERVLSEEQKVKYETYTWNGARTNYFYIRNERTKKWFNLHPKQIKRYKASREFMDALKIAHMLAE